MVHQLQSFQGLLLLTNCLSSGIVNRLRANQVKVTCFIESQVKSQVGSAPPPPDPYPSQGIYLLHVN